MRQDERAKRLYGAEGFDEFYRSQFGGRWASLKAALLGVGDPRMFDSGGKEPYFLDSASVRAAVSLPLAGAEKILDLCAAPGGKTVVLASLMEKGAALLANEKSPERRNRLFSTVRDCLPEEVSARVSVSCRDGAKMCLSAENSLNFDRILLDAPCSSERHVLSDPRHLSMWSPSRIRTLAVEQWSLLSSAWRMLAPGGFLLYSTCALVDAENDGVVSRLLKKFPDARFLPADIASDVSGFFQGNLPVPERTEFGSRILPDAQGGAGPLYFCLLRKIQ